MSPGRYRVAIDGAPLRVAPDADARSLGGLARGGIVAIDEVCEGAEVAGSSIWLRLAPSPGRVGERTPPRYLHSSLVEVLDDL